MSFPGSHPPHVHLHIVECVCTRCGKEFTRKSVDSPVYEQIHRYRQQQIAQLIRDGKHAEAEMLSQMKTDHKEMGVCAECSIKFMGAYMREYGKFIGKSVKNWFSKIWK